MKEGYIYLVIGNGSEGLIHYCVIGEILIGTGRISEPKEKPPTAHHYERESFEKTGTGIQWIHPDDVFEIGPL